MLNIAESGKVKQDKNHKDATKERLPFQLLDSEVKKNTFSLLSSGVADRRIYLDYAASTPIDKEVFRTMLPYFGLDYSNPSSVHTSGRKAKRIIENARIDISKIINSNDNEIIFTSGGTEANNLAILGFARANRQNGNHIIISSIEHKSIIEAVNQLEKEGFEISFMPVDNFGRIKIEECLTLITTKTILISVMYVNNEIGTIQPIKELSERIKNETPFKPLIHTDACQAANLFSLDVKDLGVDLMTINSSKIYGPAGIGLLYKRNDIKLHPIVFGGGQERGLRSGTESIANIFGFSLALTKAQENRKEEYERLKSLQKYFVEELEELIPNILINVPLEFRSPSITHVTVPYIEGESMLLKLDNLGIEVSTGSACSSNDLKPSYVLLAIGQDVKLIHGSLRFSFGRHTTKEDIDRVLNIFPKIVEDLTQMSALTLKIYER